MILAATRTGRPTRNRAPRPGKLSFVPCRRHGARAASPVVALAALLAVAGCGTVGQSGEDAFRNPASASRIRVAMAAEQSGQMDIALSMYAAAAAAAPDDPAVQSRFAGALLRAGQPQQADQVLSRALERRPDDVTLLLARGRLRLATGGSQEALGLFDRVLSRDPTNTAALNGRGIALYQLGHTRQAEEAFRAVLAAAPGNVPAANNLGTLLYLEGRAAEAVAVLSDVSTRPGAPARVMTNLGIAQAAAGDRNAAQATLAGRISTEDFESLAASLGAGPPPAAAPTGGPSRADRSAALRTPPGGAPATLLSAPPNAPALTVTPVPAVAQETAPSSTPSAAATPAAAPSPATRVESAPVAAAGAPSESATEPTPAPVRAAEPTGAATDASAAQPLESGGAIGHKVQLAALPTEASAREEWRRLSREFPELFEARRPVIMRVPREGGGEIWRVRAEGFDSLGAAREFCARLRASGRTCLPLRG